MKNIPKQLIPLVIIAIALVGGLIAARALLVPESFGRYGHYRADAVDEIRAQAIVFAGADVCGECHDDVFEEKAESRHRGVSCEICHGPAASHVDAPDEFLPVIPTGRDNCLTCHAYNPSRPSGFPQVLAERHNPGRVCTGCHSPHVPAVPSAISECSACHRDIANVKVVSHHASLDCAICHEVPQEHMSNPRMVRAKKPTDVSTCAKCHDRDTEGMPGYAPPKVDIVAHTDRYLCWDCHYPHYPEARI